MQLLPHCLVGWTVMDVFPYHYQNLLAWCAGKKCYGSVDVGFGSHIGGKYSQQWM